MEDHYILISGARYYNDYRELEDVVSEVISDLDKQYRIHIVEFGNRGAEYMARVYAMVHNLEVVRHSFVEPDIEDIHKYISKMHSQEVLLFCDPITNECKNHIDLAKKYHNKIRIFNISSHKFMYMK